MIDWLIYLYPWIKSLHIIAVICWMAGLLYLPRLFIYHCDSEFGSDKSDTFIIMEEKLMRIIMRPAMIATWVFGLLLVSIPGIAEIGINFWIFLKFTFVLGLTVFHGTCNKWRKDFANNSNKKSASFFRKVNEIPTVLMILIVLLVTAKPF